MSKWNIEYVEEEQVFEKRDHGVMLVIPPSAVEKKEEVKTEIKVVAPEESDIILPPDVEVVSCFYKIETTEKFSKPIELHLQHNVELTSQEECEQLVFIKAKGPPPYKFELLPKGQEFRPYDNSAVVRLRDFTPVAVVYKKLQKIKSALFQQPSFSYVVTVFVKQMMKSEFIPQLTYPSTSYTSNCSIFKIAKGKCTMFDDFILNPIETDETLMEEGISSFKLLKRMSQRCPRCQFTMVNDVIPDRFKTIQKQMMEMSASSENVKTLFQGCYHDFINQFVCLSTSSGTHNCSISQIAKEKCTLFDDFILNSIAEEFEITQAEIHIKYYKDVIETFKVIIVLEAVRSVTMTCLFQIGLILKNKALDKKELLIKQIIVHGIIFDKCQVKDEYTFRYQLLHVLFHNL